MSPYLFKEKKNQIIEKNPCPLFHLYVFLTWSARKICSLLNEVCSYSQVRESNVLGTSLNKSKLITQMFKK